MSGFIKFIVRFFNYAFLGRIGLHDSQLVIPIEEVTISDDQAKAKSNQIFKIFIAINWTMLAMLIVSFIVIVVYSLFLSDKPVPCIIENVLTTTLAWLVGTLATFGVKPAT